MFAVVVSTILMTFQSVYGWLLPGFFLESQIPLLHKSADSLAGRIIRALALGSLYMTVQFFIAMFAVTKSGAPVWIVLTSKLLMDTFVIVLWLTIARSHLGSTLREFRAALKDTSVWALAGAAFLYGIIAVCLRPHALDNAALYWVNALVDGMTSEFQDSQGSPAYIALLYFPFLLVKSWIPLPTLAAGLKPALCLIGALAARRIALQLPLRYPKTSSVLLFGILLASFTGRYGFFETAKESVFGILFFMSFAAELLRRDQKAPAWAWQAGLVLAAAFGFGAITVPYGAALTVLFLFLGVGRTSPFGFALKLAGTTALPLIPTIHAMIKMPLWNVSAVYAAAVVAAYAFSRHLHIPAVIRLPESAARWVTFAGTAGLLCAIYWLLPVDYIISRDPLDGQTGFTDLLIRCVRTHTAHVGLAGLLITFVLPDYWKNRGLLTFAVFPFAVMLPVFVIAKLGLGIPFDPQHLWDLVKDVPNWCYGFYYGTFSLIAVDACSRLIEAAGSRVRRSDQRVYKYLAMAPLVVAACCVGNDCRKEFRSSWGQSVYYSQIGGFKERGMASLIEKLLDEKHRRRAAGKRPRFVLSKESRANQNWPYVFNMYGIYAERDFDPANRSQMRRFAARLPRYLVAGENDLSQLRRQHSEILEVDIVGSYENAGDLYRITRKIPRTAHVFMHKAAH